MIKQGDTIEYLTMEDYWEVAICVEAGKESFSFLCLDGQIRILKYCEQNVKWR